MPAYRAISGARAKLFINNVPVGWATGVSCQEAINQQAIEILGEIDPAEIEATGRTITMTADFVRILSNSLVDQGIWKHGDAAAIIDANPMTAEIRDGITDDVIYKIEGLKCQSRNFRVDKGGLMTVNATYMGIRLYQENDA